MFDLQILNHHLMEFPQENHHGGSCNTQNNRKPKSTTLQQNKENTHNIVSNHSMSLLRSLEVVHHEFMSKFDMSHFVLSQATLNATNHQIMRILDAIVDNGLSLDVAFTQINALITPVALRSHFHSSRLSLQYHEFLFHFLLFGCCLGTKYTKPIHWQQLSSANNMLLSYFIAKFKSNWPSHIQYSYCGSRREAIITTITSNFKYDHYGIAVLVADFTSFEFEDFLYVITNWTSQRQLKQFCNTDSGTIPRIHRYWNHMGFKAGSYVFTIPKLLLNSLAFCMEMDSNLKYFANQMLFRTIYWEQPVDHYKMIRNLFACHITIHPWDDPVFLIECFEEYKNVFGGVMMLEVLEQCVDPRFDRQLTGKRTHRALSIFVDNIFGWFRIAGMNVRDVLRATYFKLPRNKPDAVVQVSNSISILYHEFVCKLGNEESKIFTLLSYQLWLYIKLCQRTKAPLPLVSAVLKSIDIASHPFVKHSVHNNDDDDNSSSMDIDEAITE
eukprot:60371_1